MYSTVGTGHGANSIGMCRSKPASLFDSRVVSRSREEGGVILDSGDVRRDGSRLDGGAGFFYISYSGTRMLAANVSCGRSYGRFFESSVKVFNRHPYGMARSLSFFDTKSCRPVLHRGATSARRGSVPLVLLNG